MFESIRFDQSLTLADQLQIIYHNHLVLTITDISVQTLQSTSIIKIYTHVIDDSQHNFGSCRPTHNHHSTIFFKLPPLYTLYTTPFTSPHFTELSNTLSPLSPLIHLSSPHSSVPFPQIRSPLRNINFLNHFNLHFKKCHNHHINTHYHQIYNIKCLTISHTNHLQYRTTKVILCSFCCSF